MIIIPAEIPAAASVVTGDTGEMMYDGDIV